MTVGLDPELDAIAEAVVVDDDEQVEIRALAIGGVGSSALQLNVCFPQLADVR